MSLSEEVELLRSIPLFAGVEASKLKLLAFASERLTYQPGSELFKQGDAGDSAYLIIEGEADVLRESARGPVTVARLGRNHLVGEIAILCEVPRTATVKAATRLVVLKIAKDLFFRLVTEFPLMAVAVMRELAHRVEAANLKLEAMYTGSGR